MESARTTLRIMRGAMLFCILIYAFMLKQFPSHARPNPVVYYAILVLVAWIIAALFYFYRKFVKDSEKILAQNPGDRVAQRRWQTGYLLTYAFGEAIALYGLVLHFLGFGTIQVAPLLVVGFALIVVYSPRIPVPLRD